MVGASPAPKVDEMKMLRSLDLNFYHDHDIHEDIVVVDANHGINDDKMSGPHGFVEILMVEREEGASVERSKEVDRLLRELLRLARLRSVQDRHLLPLLHQLVVDADDGEHHPSDRLEGDSLLPLVVCQPRVLLVLVRGRQIVPGWMCNMNSSVTCRVPQKEVLLEL